MEEVVSEELKPCPFCGGNKARTIHIRDGRKVKCPCGACGTPEFHGPLDRPDAEARAITAWNTRAADAELATLRAQNEALREAASIAADELEGFVDFAVRQCEFEGDEVAGYEAVKALRNALAQVAK